MNIPTQHFYSCSRSGVCCIVVCDFVKTVFIANDYYSLLKYRNNGLFKHCLENEYYELKSTWHRKEFVLIHLGKFHSKDNSPIFYKISNVLTSFLLRTLECRIWISNLMRSFDIFLTNVLCNNKKKKHPILVWEGPAYELETNVNNYWHIENKTNYYATIGSTF